MRLRGVPVVAGTAYGPTVVVPPSRAVDEATGPSPVGASQADAADRYDRAVETVATDIRRAAAQVTGVVADVLSATAELAADRALRAAVLRRLQEGATPVLAVDAAVGEHAAMLEQAGGAVAERAVDLRDVGRRVVAALCGEPDRGVPAPQEPSVVVAAELAPLDAAALDPTKVLALVTEHGGPTGHTAVIARELGIPCVMGVAGLLQSVGPGTTLLVDGATGEVDTDPDEDSSQARVARDTAARAATASWTGPGATRDGRRVTLLANVADGASARAASATPVEGVGLFRTEMCFLGRSREPSVAEQSELYAEVLDAFGPERPVVVRTLDAGSDKPIPYAGLGEERNPALGGRGVRLSRANPGLLERQVAAVADAGRRTRTRPSVMAPMVSTVAEARDFAALGHAHGLRAGVMVEVPAAALGAERLLEHVDFLSVGTNDLTQYTMAADRSVAGLASLADPWQPAVLTLVAMTAAAGRTAGKPVGVCGEAAADPDLAAVLVGLGVTSLSMAPGHVRAVGARLATLSLAECEHAAEAALAAEDAVAAREAVRRVLSA